MTILVANLGAVKPAGGLPLIAQEAADAVDEAATEASPAEAGADVGRQGLGIGHSPVGDQAASQRQRLLGLDPGVDRLKGRAGRRLVDPLGPQLLGDQRVPATRGPASHQRGGVLAVIQVAVSFRPIQGGEVIVRSDHPLEYGVSDDAGAVLLHLPSAAIPLPNNRRPLDTRFFHGAVERVVPLPVAGGTDVRIELRQHAEYQLAQNGSVLTVTFSAAQ